MKDAERILREELEKFLRGGEAHASVTAALKDLPAEFYAVRPAGDPHTAWQMLEHIRITLEDLVEFSTNPQYRARKWPDEYWPKQDGPASEESWEASAAAIEKSLAQFAEMLRSPDVNLTERIPWGDGQTILREILLAVDHTSYHVGQLILLRKQLGAWKG